MGNFKEKEMLNWYFRVLLVQALFLCSSIYCIPRPGFRRGCLHVGRRFTKPRFAAGPTTAKFGSKKIDSGNGAPPNLKQNMEDNEAQIKALRETEEKDRADVEAQVNQYKDANGKINQADLPKVDQIVEAEKAKETEAAKPLMETKKAQLKALKTFEIQVKNLDRRAVELNMLIKKMNDHGLTGNYKPSMRGSRIGITG